MSLLKFILSYFFIFLLLLKMITSQETCSTSQCSANEPKIDVPFGVKDRQGDKCAYQGFTITCNSLGKTVLKLPNAGDFFVETVSYGTKEIKLSDPLNCLPYRYLQSSASLTNLSPFMGFSYHSYAFYECPQFIINDPVLYTVLSQYAFTVSCYSLSNGALLITTPASSTDSFQMNTNQGFIDYGCRLKDSVSIPIPARAAVDIYSYNVVKDYLYLTWTEPRNHDDPKAFKENKNTTVHINHWF
ncbi:hypothetical protein MKW98_022357 [Papaver atlanticum]|uniref:RING-type E3 ubiquitin transferase n=1 Tax=Papaver atlanticum TaxID=357466 RepID=A0AAD4SMX6_9MAGN|nr:hypothetical protein MKW98_022357 [Papaver atlanticum]